LLLLLASLPACAFGPKEALVYRSAETQVMRERVKIAEWAYRMVRLSTTGNTSTSLQENSKQSYALSLRFDPNPVNVLDAQRTLETTSREVARLARADVTAALLAHASLWEAQAGAETAQARVSLAQMTADEAKRKHEIGALSLLDQELTGIEVRDAELGRRRAEQALLSTKAEAIRLALAEKADPVTVSFRLKEPRLEQSPEIFQTEWERRMAKTKERRARREYMPALVADAFHSGKTNVSASVSSRGAVNALVGYPTLYDPTFLLYGAGWTYSLRLDIPIDPLNWVNARQAHNDARLAEARLVKQRAQLKIQFEQARRDAEAAGATLALAQERLTLLQRKQQILQAKMEAGAASKLDTLNAGVASSDAGIQVAKAWGMYLKAVSAYLELTNAEWEAK